jgi:L-iditol 2-dehydrogenase
MPEKLLHKIPNGVSLEEAAMAEPSAIVAHQLLERARITPGDNVVIMGVGPIALLSAQMAKIAGAKKIYLCGCESDVDYRLKIANELNCYDTFINVQKQDVCEIVYKETGLGADIVIEASGAGSAITSAIRVLKKRGLLCAIGMTAREKVEVPWNEAMMKVLDVQFNMSSSYNGWNIALSLLESKKINLLPMISIKPLDKWQEAFDELQQGKAMKILLKP